MTKLIYKDKNFYKVVAVIAIPITLQSFITTGVNMMDTIMVGALGETELSAVSLANQFINIYQILCMGIGMGASVLIARYYGMKEKKSMQKTIAIMLQLCIGIAAIFSAATLFFPQGIMSIYTNDNMIMEKGLAYLRWSVVTYFFFGLSLTSTIVLRSIGKVRLPLYTSIGAFFIDVAANYVFIFGKLGMPQMGVAEAAVGTLIARVFEFAVICGYLFVRENEIGFRLKHLFMNARDLWKEYLRISLPVLISDAILALGNNSVAMVIGRIGESFVAANAITSVTQQLSTVVIQGVSQAASIVTGHTLGAGEKEKAQEQGYAFLGLGIGFGVLTAIVIMMISRPVIYAYQVSEQTAAVARQLMASISIIILFQATNNIMTKGTLRGGGDTTVLMVADNLFLWVASIPLGILAGLVLHLPPFWIYFFLKIDQVIKCIWCVFRLRSGKWIKKISAASGN